MEAGSLSGACKVFLASSLLGCYDLETACGDQTKDDSFADSKMLQSSVMPPFFYALLLTNLARKTSVWFVKVVVLARTKVDEAVESIGHTHIVS